MTRRNAIRPSLPISVFALGVFAGCADPSPEAPCVGPTCDDDEATGSTTDAGFDPGTETGDPPLPDLTTTGPDLGESSSSSSSEGPTDNDDSTSTGEVTEPNVCGDGRLADDEVCDDGDDNGTYGHCAADCTGVGSHCGDGEVQPEETCDDGELNGAYDHCAADCSGPGLRCGDQVVQAGEVCDDGDADGDDGCEVDCTETQVLGLVSGGGHNCVRFGGGGVKCWGVGSSGQLGYGDGETIGDDETPASVGTLDLGAPAVQLALGHAHTCAVLEGGGVKCWGRNDDGQLGYGHADPIGVAGGPTVLRDLGLVDVGGVVTALVAGRAHTCALIEDGSVRCWGANGFRQRGLGPQAVGVGVPRPELPVISTAAVDYALSRANRSSVVQLVSGANHLCVRTQLGYAVCWGDNAYGQLGVVDPRAYGPLTLHARNLALVGAGSSHSCGLMADQLWCSGRNDGGQVGQNMADGNRAFLGRVSVLPEIGNAEIQQVVGGDLHTCARYSNGELRCWGRNDRGQVGTGELAVTIGDEPDEIAPVVGTPVVQVSAGPSHTCALFKGEGVRCWGANSGDRAGALGYGDTTDRVGPADELPLIELF